MKQALTSAGERSVWYECAWEALTASGVTLSTEENTTLTGEHPEYGSINVVFSEPEPEKTRMEITADTAEMYDFFKRTVGMAFLRLKKKDALTESASPKQEKDPAHEQVPSQPAEAEATKKPSVIAGIIPGTECKKCGAALDKNDRVCPQCGAKRLTSNMLIMGIVGVVLAVAAICFLVFSQNKPSETPVTEQESTTEQEVVIVSEESLPTEEGVVSLEMYGKVQEGLSYSEVCGLFGEEGILLRELDYQEENGSNAELQVYYWSGKGENSANTTITFKDDAVITKAQYGLN